eukprot:5040950-Ditylum_brightwellii.AAC.1
MATISALPAVVQMEQAEALVVEPLRELVPAKEVGSRAGSSATWTTPRPWSGMAGPGNGARTTATPSPCGAPEQIA